MPLGYDRLTTWEFIDRLANIAMDPNIISPSEEESNWVDNKLNIEYLGDDVEKFAISKAISVALENSTPTIQVNDIFQCLEFDREALKSNCPSRLRSIGGIGLGLFVIDDFIGLGFDAGQKDHMPIFHVLYFNYGEPMLYTPLNGNIYSNVADSISQVALEDAVEHCNICKECEDIQDCSVRAQRENCDFYGQQVRTLMLRDMEKDFNLDLVNRTEESERCEDCENCGDCDSCIHNQQD